MRGVARWRSATPRHFESKQRSLDEYCHVANCRSESNCTRRSLLLDRSANRYGQSENGLAKAGPPKQRIIDLRVGDWLRFRDTVRKIFAVGAYRDARWEGDWRTPSRDGYIVCEAS